MGPVRVSGYPKYLIYSDGRIYSDYRKRFLKPCPGAAGYMKVVLCDGKKKKDFNLHRLIAEHYIPNPRRFPIVHHINHNKLDNRIENLEWCTQSHNVKAAVIAGRARGRPGEESPMAILTSRDVIKIRRLRAKGLTYARIAWIFGITSRHAQKIGARYIWKHI